MERIRVLLRRLVSELAHAPPGCLPAPGYWEPPTCHCSPAPALTLGDPCIISSHVQLGLEGDSGRSRHPYNCNYTSLWVSLEFPTVASIASALLCLTENGTYHDLPLDWVSRVGAAGHEGTSPNPLSQDQPSFFPALQGKLSWKGARTASTAWGDPSHPQAAIPGISRWIAWLRDPLLLVRLPAQARASAV